MKTAFDILHYGVKDSQGDVFLPGSLKFPNKIKLLKDFDQSRLLGYVELIDEPDKVLALGDIENLSGLTPGIGFRINKFKVEDGMRVIEDAELICVSVGLSPNPDKTINPLP